MVRNFKNNHSKNSCVFGIFDASRIVEGGSGGGKGGGGAGVGRGNHGNYFLLFSCEPAEDLSAIGVTRTLFDHLTKKQNENNGILELPNALLDFKHDGAELVISSESPLILNQQKAPQQQSLSQTMAIMSLD